MEILNNIPLILPKFLPEQEIDGKALIFLAKEGSASQFNTCGLSTVGEQNDALKRISV